MASFLTDRREYSGGAIAQLTTTDMTNTSLVVSIDGSTNWPSGASSTGFFVLVAEGSAAEEKMLVSLRTGNQLTISQRAVDGSTAFAHPAGAKIRCWYTAQDADEANDHTSSANGVHGVEGNVLGDLDTQFVYNKTFDGTNAFIDYSLSPHDHSNAVNGGATAHGTLQALSYQANWSDYVGGAAGLRGGAGGSVRLSGGASAAAGAGASITQTLPHPLDGEQHVFTIVDFTTVQNVVVTVSPLGNLSINTAGHPISGHTYYLDGITYQS